MFLKKAERDNEKETYKFEQQAMFFGDLQALIANCHRDAKKQPTPWHRSDFYTLSIDKQDKPKKVSTRLTPEEVQKLVDGK